MEHTAKNFVLQLGSLIALYVSLSAVITVSFSIINIAFPDEAAGYYEYDSAQNSIRFGIAMIIVFFPAYIVLTRIVNQMRRKSEAKYLTLTKWLIYLSLLVGGGILLGDLVAVIWTYLNGEITTRFLLKAFVLAVVIGAAFKYYILDARGYWTMHEEQSKLFGALSLVLVVTVLVLGFIYADSPQEVRERRLDERQIVDLQDMQWRIDEYYRVNGTLPPTLDALYVDGLGVPEAPDGRDEYAYRIVDAQTFELCATFASKTTASARSVAPLGSEGIKNPYNWDHGTGQACFERVINR